jgi:hypothetical protein
MAFLGGIMTIIAGILLGVGLAEGMLEGIRFALFENFVSVPILIVLAASLPKTPAEKDVDFDALAEAEKDAASPSFPVGKTVALVLSVTFSNLIYCVMAYQYALYLPENFVLDPAVVGVLGSVEAFAGGIAGFVFALIFKLTKRFTITIAFLLYVVCFSIFGFLNTSLPLVSVGLALNGFAFGLSLSYFYSYTAITYHPKHESLIAGFLTVGMGLGMFLNTFLTTFFTEQLGLVSFDAITEMPVTDHVAFMPYVAAVALVCTVLSLVLAIRETRSGLKIGDGPA